MNDQIARDFYLLVVILSDENQLDTILLAMTGICGSQVTVIDGITASETLSQQIPMFAQLLGIGRGRVCKVLLSTVTEPDAVTRLAGLLNDAGIDFIGRSMGEMFTIRLSETILTGMETCRL